MNGTKMGSVNVFVTRSLKPQLLQVAFNAAHLGRRRSDEGCTFLLSFSMSSGTLLSQYQSLIKFTVIKCWRREKVSIGCSADCFPLPVCQIVISQKLLSELHLVCTWRLLPARPSAAPRSAAEPMRGEQDPAEDLKAKRDHLFLDFNLTGQAQRSQSWFCWDQFIGGTDVTKWSGESELR